MRRLLGLTMMAVLALSVARAEQLPSTPLTQDPLGPLSDITAHWQDYQPASDFCVRVDVFQLTSAGPTVGSDDPRCANSGFLPGEKGLVPIHVVTPALCEGCRRMFIDYSKIPAEDAVPYYYAHGHAYFRLDSLNPGYTMDPVEHSPNIKNLTNDKLFVPDGSPQSPAVALFDTHAITLTGNTTHTIYSQEQGPYYAGPWYVNQAGARITGAFLDVQPSALGELPVPALNEITYGAAFYSGEPTCIDPLFTSFGDADGYYGGCFDRFGGSAEAIDPFAN